MSAAVVQAEPAIRLFPRQMRFVQDPARFPGYVGGIGSGKSFAGAAKVLARLGSKQIGGVYAPTYPMLRDATKRTLLALLDELGIRYIHHISDNVITIPASGHEIICRSLDNPDSLRGPNLDYAWVDEASLADRASWAVVKGRVRTGPHPQAWATFTPKGRNWCWEEWERDANPNHPLYRVQTTENPELPPGFAESLGYAGRFAEQELGGLFVAFEGLVYPAFQRDNHMHEVDCADWPAVLGVDAGTRNPSAILTIRHSGDRRHIEREVYRRGMGSRDLVAAIEAEADACTAQAIYIDPSALDVITDLMADGYYATKANNNVGDGIREMTSLLEIGERGPSLTVDPSCVNLIAEFESYSYPDGGHAEKDNPIKANDHACDAARYACMGLSAPAVEFAIY